MNISITIESPKLQLFASHLAPAALIGLNQAMGEGVKEKTRDYLGELALSRHATANRLGASPTGFLAEAARAVEATPVEADAGGAGFTINHPGMARAFGDVTIVPINAQYLTIPINALAYGRRVGEFGGKVVLLMEGGHRETSERKRKPIPLDLPVFFLVRSVTQHQDRTLLPSDSEWKSAAIDAGIEWIEQNAEQILS